MTPFGFQAEIVVRVLEAIRQALLSEKNLAASQGVYNFTEKDRYGVDERARILLTVKDGKFAVVK
jgi:branched-chain amino acid transport system substrate-binding protein